MKYTIPIYRPTLDGNELSYVNDCLESSWISSKGEYVTKFEKSFSEYVGIDYSTAVSNGTVALHLALLSLGIGKGDEVIVPTLTYIASVNSITYTGATPVFTDSLMDTLQVDPDDILKRITSKTKAIIVVHLYGHPCNMNRIMKIANKYNLFVIEDCAEAFGSKYEQKNVGTFGHVSTFSFFGNKTITTGEGGMVVTSDPAIHKNLVKLKGQGLADDRQYWHDIIGYNYRMTNICGAIGLAQLENADSVIAKKRNLALTYKELLKELPLKFHSESDKCFHTYWMVTVFLDNSSNRDLLRKHLEFRGIETRPTFYPVHTMPMYNSKSQVFPIAETLGSTGINLPSWPSLSQSDIEFIVQSIVEFFNP